MLEHEAQIIPVSTLNLGQKGDLALTPSSSDDSEFATRSKRSSCSSLAQRTNNQESSDEMLQRMIVGDNERLLLIQERQMGLEERKLALEEAKEKREAEKEERRLALEEAKEKREAEKEARLNEEIKEEKGIRNEVHALANVVSQLIDKVSQLQR